MMPVSIGSDSIIDDDATVGYDLERIGRPTAIGTGARIRAGTVIYAGVEIGERFTTGHGALIREDTTIGDDVLVGSSVVIDGTCTVGSHVSMQTGCYVPAETRIGDRVFIGPAAVLTNDKHPIRQDADLRGPTIEDDVSIGANATILPEVRLGAGSFVAAGSVVTRDVPPATLAIGSPARHRELPQALQGGNHLA